MFRLHFYHCDAWSIQSYHYQLNHQNSGENQNLFTIQRFCFHKTYLSKLLTIDTQWVYDVVLLVIPSLSSLQIWALQWRHNGRDGISNHQPHNYYMVYSNVYSGGDQRKHQCSVSLAFARGPVNSPHKWPVTRKMFPFDDVIMDCMCSTNPFI